MRISLIGPIYPYRGGIAQYNAQFAKALTERHTVQIISFRRQYPAFLYPGASDKDPSRSALQLTASYLLDPIYPWTWLDASRKILDFSPDLVVFHWWTTFWGPAFGSIARRMAARKKDVVFLIHNTLPHEPKFWDRWLARWTLDAGTRFIAQTERESERLQGILPHAHVVVAPHPVYDMFSEQKIPRDQALHKCSVPEGYFCLLFFGIVRPYKGLQTLIESLALLKQWGCKVFLLIAGEFWEDVARYQKQIAQLDVQDRVSIDNRYIPNEEIGTYFSAAHVLVAPYVDATQSGVVKLAVGFDLPIIISQEVAADSSIITTMKGMVCPSNDPLALAKVIQNMMDKYPEIEKKSYETTNGWQTLVDLLANPG